jgi:hypothetical protein
LIKVIPPRTRDLGVTRDDIDNLSGPYQFALNSDNANNYKFDYVGKERLANIDLYVFDVTPLSFSSKLRLFRGRIWIGVDSLRILKTRGKFEQKGEQRFPMTEMYRDVIDNRFLFPAGGSGDDELMFPNGQSTHLRFSVRYFDYVAK